MFLVTDHAILNYFSYVRHGLYTARGHWLGNAWSTHIHIISTYVIANQNSIFSQIIEKQFQLSVA